MLEYSGLKIDRFADIPVCPRVKKKKDNPVLFFPLYYFSLAYRRGVQIG